MLSESTAKFFCLSWCHSLVSQSLHWLHWLQPCELSVNFLRPSLNSLFPLMRHWSLKWTVTFTADRQVGNWLLRSYQICIAQSAAQALIPRSQTNDIKCSFLLYKKVEMELSNDPIKKVIFFRMGCTTLKKEKRKTLYFLKRSLALCLKFWKGLRVTVLILNARNIIRIYPKRPSLTICMSRERMVAK